MEPTRNEGDDEPNFSGMSGNHIQRGGILHRECVIRSLRDGDDLVDADATGERAAGVEEPAVGGVEREFACPERAGRGRIASLGADFDANLSIINDAISKLFNSSGLENYNARCGGSGSLSGD